MNISVIGAGYVGLVTGACFAELGNHVTCIDINQEKINNLNQGILPIYEPGLDTLIHSNHAAGRLHFATSIEMVQQEPQVIFIAVGTPSDQAGSADLQYVLEAAKNIGNYINQYCVIVDKSTVPVGMADQVEAVIREALKKKSQAISFDVVSNPEFLREGAAIDDFMRPRSCHHWLFLQESQEHYAGPLSPSDAQHRKIYFMNVKDAK